MMKPQWVVSVFLASATALIPVVSMGQTYPNKAIRILTGGAGGNTGLATRIVAQGLTKNLGQQVIVDNREPLVAMDLATRATPDGYTLLLMGNPLWLTPFMQNVPYDPVSGFTPISTIDRAPSILVVNSSFPAKSAKELIELAKARPGELNCGSGNRGAGSNLAGELFKAMAGINVVVVPYKGAAPAITGLMSNDVQFMFATAGSVTPLIKSGKLKAIAVTGAKPFSLMPELPTVTSSGLPGYESETIEGLFGPAKLPKSIIDRVNRDTVTFLASDEAREQFVKLGEEASPSAPEELVATVKAEMARLGKLIKDAGIRAE